MASVSSKKVTKKAAPKKKRASGIVGTQILLGDNYVTTHTCPGCEACQVTTGTCYPRMVCVCCNLTMRTQHTLMEQNNDR